jgi:hypothetical protein
MAARKSMGMAAPEGAAQQHPPQPPKLVFNPAASEIGYSGARLGEETKGSESGGPRAAK